MTSRRTFATSLALAAPALWLAAAPAAAQGTPTTEVIQQLTRAGVQVPLFAVWNPQAVATLVLWSGGGGGYGRLGPDGWPNSSNFLIRTGKLWAAQPFNIVMVGRSSDNLDLSDGQVRIGEAHAADNRAILQAIRQRSPLPLWLVGTSMGTISATATAINDDAGLVAGLVLSSSVTAYRIPGAVPRQALARIRVPTLVVHNARDACRICTPREAEGMMGDFKNAPAKELVLVTTGDGAYGDTCGPTHFHGYIGAEQSTVEMIAGWVRQHG